jgi:malonyl-CoA/methylmalonyl-CoA synthetase
MTEDTGSEADNSARESEGADRELPHGEIGEVQVRGPGVFLGYWNDPDKTTTSFDGEWLRTGDLGRLDPDDRLRLILSGRCRELIISGGFNIYPREVEELLESRAEVQEAAVVGVPDEDLGERVVAFVIPSAIPADGSAVPSDGSATTGDGIVSVKLKEALSAFCEKNLSPHKRPRRIVIREALPRNALGKIQKEVLRASLG